ncbi:MAG: histidine phosphatase family protein [Gemmatimonadota bacterium]|nr:MAG: histidine phosphatase family protein [Gemmatimonadota bacterium]
MNLLVVRHAAAERREAFAETGQDDSSRPLTAAGRKRMEQCLNGLKRLVPEIDSLATSPLTRAAQTAEMVAAEYGTVVPVHLEHLAPGGERRAVLSWIQMQRDESTIAVVGHEPDLGSMVSWLLASTGGRFVGLKKGGACLLTWKSHVTAGDADLVWLLTSGQLRRIGKKKKKKKKEKEAKRNATSSPQSGVVSDEQE